MSGNDLQPLEEEVSKEEDDSTFVHLKHKDDVDVGGLSTENQS